MAHYHVRSKPAGAGLPKTTLLFHIDCVSKVLYLDNRAGLRTITKATTVASMRMGAQYRIKHLPPTELRSIRQSGF